MKYLLDAHTHTLASGHAYNTMKEMAQAAKERGLELLGITDHAPNMPGSCHEYHFENFRIIDRNAYAVPILLGCELNIIDENGSVDLRPDLLQKMDYNIASLHPPCIHFLSKSETTNTIIRCIENPAIHIIGHLDDARFPVDYEAVVKAAKEYHTLLEVNNSSLLPTSYRSNAKENYTIMLKACEHYQVPVILNSDAHVDTAVGRHDASFALLQEIDFPEELVVNTSVDKFKSFIQ